MGAAVTHDYAPHITADIQASKAAEPIRHSIYPRWEVDWTKVDWGLVAQDCGLAKKDECQFCGNEVLPGSLVCCACYAKGCRCFVSDPIAAANVAAIYACQPKPAEQKYKYDKARRTLVPVEQKPADPRAEGIARAIAGMNSHEPRLGSSRFQP